MQINFAKKNIFSFLKYLYQLFEKNNYITVNSSKNKKKVIDMKIKFTGETKIKKIT